MRKKNFTDKCQIHEQCGFTIYIVSSIDKYKFKQIVYRGETKEEVSNQFIETIQQLEES